MNDGFFKKFFTWLIPLVAAALLTTWLINPGSTTVPNVVGKSRSEAVAEITDAGFTPYVEPDDGSTAKLVQSESPKGGEWRRKGTTVALIFPKEIQKSNVSIPQTASKDYGSVPVPAPIPNTGAPSETSAVRQHRVLLADRVYIIVVRVCQAGLTVPEIQRCRRPLGVNAGSTVAGLEERLLRVCRNRH